MAKLIQCKDCGNQISKNAASCPNCGAKNKKTSVVTWLVLIFIGLPMLMGIFNSAFNDDTASNEPQSLVSESSDNPQGTAPITQNWDYTETVDQMRNSTTYLASSVSSNSVDLGFPYSGGTKLSIAIRHTPSEGNEVMIITDNGQLWCEYQNCNMSVKFDNNPIEKYSLSDAAAGASETKFVTKSSDFINKLKQSDKAVIEIGFYDNGKQQFTFDVSDLDWQH